MTPPLAVLVLALTALVVAAAAYLGSFVPTAGWFALTLASLVFSGNSAALGLPVSPDRPLFAIALASLVLDLRAGRVPHRIHPRPVHLALAAAVVYGVLSALAAGTLTTQPGLFGLLDRYGVVPFAEFVLAPLVFFSRRSRSLLLAVLVAVGAYLGVTALLEGVGLGRLAWPGYIADPAVGLHYGRARGPFVEAVADGLALFECAVACAVAVVTWRARAARVAAAAVGGLCLVGTVFTLTRAVWLASAAVVLVTVAIVPALRRFLVPLAALGTAAVLGVFLLVPGLSGQASERAAEQLPVWDRLNANATAVRILADRPLTGIGWQGFPAAAHEYVRQAPDYPVTATGIEVHNVFLSRAVELGLPGVTVWVVALGAAIGGALVRRGPPELLPWRVGLFAVALHWVIVANFGPLPYAFPNSLLWLWAGIVAAPFTSRVLPRAGLPRAPWRGDRPRQTAPPSRRG